MKLQRRFLALLTIITLTLTIPAVSVAAPAGSCAFTLKAPTINGVHLNILQWVCTADGAGAVLAPTISGDGYDAEYSGTITQVEIIPGTGGDQPDDNFVVGISYSDDATVDKAGGVGAACDETNTTWGMPVDPVNSGISQVFRRALIPYATGCGATNKFTVKIIIMPF
jgi:hypothetical protein